MTYLTHLECSDDGKRYSADAPHTDVGGPGSLLAARYDLARIRADVDRDSLSQGPATLWRYAALLPAADPANAVTLAEGWTPMLPCPALGRSLGMNALMVKDEGRNPTGSFKDRGASVALTRYRELGVHTVALNSSGNAGAAWSLYAARAGMRCVSLLPTDNQPASRTQCIAAAGTAYVVEDWHSAGAMVREATKAHGWLNVNTLLEPYRLEGKKTMGLEIAEQSGWTLPDAVFYPMGGGTGAIAIWKAFEELIELGWVRGPMPRMFITQYEGCAPLVKAYEEGRERAEAWGRIDILPGGLKSPKPPGDRAVLRLLRETGGAALAVSTADALAAVGDLARNEGVFACPEGATTLAGLRKALARGLIASGERVVLVNTGSGLKSVPSLPDAALPVVTCAAQIV
jgi:threonine synthase